MEDLIIIGSGPAGYTAGIYGARAGLKPKIIAGPLPGGQLINTTEVENWPGDGDQLMGPALMERMKEHCVKLGVELITDSISKVDFSASPLKLTGAEGEYQSKSIILASGASPKMLGLAGEDDYLGKGVSSCATCDGFFFKDQEVLVVGGGNVAAEDALFLSRICKKVTLVHRRDQLRAEKILQDKLFAAAKDGNVELVWDSQLVAYKGDVQGINGAVIKDKSGKETNLDLAGIFIAIGHTPNSEFLTGQIEMNDGYVALKNNLGPNFTATSVPGVFAAGDIADHHYRQAITSAGMGCMAALDANSFLQAS